MYKLDPQERLIVRELIRDPQISDNQIALRTNVPLKTANRKRKLLEEQGYLRYFCQLDLSHQGTGSFSGRCMFISQFKEGVTRKRLLESYGNSQKVMGFFPKHIVHTFAAEQEGNLALITVVESHQPEDLLEIYNAEIIPELEAHLGQGCVKATQMLPVTRVLRTMRNYLLDRNVTAGRIKEDWNNDFIFTDD